MDKGHIEILKILAPLSKHNHVGTAAICGSKAIMEILVEHNANINQIFDKGQTALHIASHHGHLDCVRYLLDHGANIDAKDLWGNTALHEAAYSGSIETVLAILGHNPDISHYVNMNGWTALHVASRESHASCVKLLSEGSNNIQNKCDIFGVTAGQYCNVGRRSYQIDEEPFRDIMGNLTSHNPEKKATIALNVNLHQDDKITLSRCVYHQTVIMVEMIRAVAEYKNSQTISQKGQNVPVKWPTIFTLTGCGIVKPDGNVQMVKDTIKKFLLSLIKKMTTLHDQTNQSAIKLHAEIGGSTAEGTKVGLPDEFDCHICLDDFENLIDITKVKEHSVDVQIKIKEDRGEDSEAGWSMDESADSYEDMYEWEMEKDDPDRKFDWDYLYRVKDPTNDADVDYEDMYDDTSDADDDYGDTFDDTPDIDVDYEDMYDDRPDTDVDYEDMYDDTPDADVDYEDMYDDTPDADVDYGDMFDDTPDTDVDSEDMYDVDVDVDYENMYDLHDTDNDYDNEYDDLQDTYSDYGKIRGLDRSEIENHLFSFLFGNSGTNYELKPERVYKYLYSLLCRALSDPSTFEGLPLCWKYIEKEQIHLEWRGNNFQMMAIKIDVVFVAKMDDWYTQKGRQQSCLLTKPCRDYNMRVLLRGRSWSPSYSTQENEIMNNIPKIPKTAYCLAKIINSLLKYDKKQMPYRVKTYDLKNALMYEVDKYLTDQGLTLDQYYSQNDLRDLSVQHMSKEWDIEDVLKCLSDDYFLQEVRKWTLAICRQGLRRLLSEGGDQSYYFSKGRSRMRQSEQDRLLSYVHAVLGKV